MSMRRAISVFTLLFSFVVLVFCQPHPSVTLNWSWSQGTGDPATGFHVQRGSTTGGPYTTVGTVPVGTLTYLDTAVTVGTTYYYVVTAYNSAGDSPRSNEVAAVVPFQAPAAPSTLSATPQ